MGLFFCKEYNFNLPNERLEQFFVVIMVSALFQIFYFKANNMKKLLFGLLVFTATNVSAQTGVKAGLKVGANISNFSGGNFEEIKNKSLVGFHAGGFLNVRFGKLSLQPELLVSTAGAKLEDIDGNSENFKLTYLTLPVMLRFHTVGGLYLEAGPQVGFKLGEDIGDETISDFAKDLDLSLGAGLGFQTKGGLGIGARYLIGVSRVGDFDAGSIDPDFKNGVLQVGIFFRL